MKKRKPKRPLPTRAEKLFDVPGQARVPKNPTGSTRTMNRAERRLHARLWPTRGGP